MFYISSKIDFNTEWRKRNMPNNQILWSLLLWDVLYSQNNFALMGML